MKLKSLLAMGLVAGVSFFPLHSQAQIPVTDAASIAQQIQNLTQQIAQLEQLRQQVQNTIRQIQLAESQIATLTGDYNLDQLANSQAFKDLRRVGADWEGILSPITDNGNSANESLGREIIEEYGIVEGDELYFSDDDDELNPLIMAHEKSRNAIGASGSVSRMILEGDERRVDVYEAFIDQIGSSPNQKSSTDLQARIAAENGLMMNELIRLMAVNLDLQQVILARELASDQAEADFTTSEIEEAITP